MTYTEIGYHGTAQVNSERIIRNGFRPSKGDRHWLGDGIYFFTEKFYAYKWRYDKYRADIKKHSGAYSFDCCIIKALINTADERVFDLTKFEHMNELRSWQAEIEKLMPRSKWGNRAVPEGVVLNYMFNKSGVTDYYELFDVVKAMFQWPSMKYSNESKLPSVIPQMQLCVKNSHTPSGQLTIQDIAEYNYQHEIDKFETLLTTFEEQKQRSTNQYPGRFPDRVKDNGNKYRKT